LVTVEYPDNETDEEFLVVDAFTPYEAAISAVMARIAKEPKASGWLSVSTEGATNSNLIYDNAFFEMTSKEYNANKEQSQ